MKKMARGGKEIVMVKISDDMRRRICRVLRHFGVARAGIFGSFARGEAAARSDIDILVEFRGSKSLLDLATLEMELEKRMHRKADVLTYASIHPLLRKRILEEEVRIL